MSQKPWILSLSLAALISGCAGEKSASSRDLDRLHEEVRELQLAVAGSESRLRSLERQMDLLARREAVDGGSRASAYVMPEELEVVRLRPPPAQPEPPIAMQEDEDSFAFISIGGSRPPAQTPPASPRVGGGGADSAPPLPTQTPLREDPAIRKRYEAARALLEEGRLEEGIEELEAFLAAHPHDVHADNALLALGEAWLLRGAPKRALEAFEGVIRRYPAGDAIPMSLMRYGDALLALGESERARAAFSRLIEEFPGSPAAAMARKKLPLLEDGES